MASDLEVLILIPAASLHTRLQTAPAHAEGPVTKGSPAGVQHVLGTGLTYCRQCRTKLLLRSYRDRTALSKGPGPHTVQEHSPQNTTRDTVECLLQIHKAHVDWLGKLP
ncbi:hypothetical protein L3Q82_013939 [Scortum barcoo]|uniref:Uncharacterized protein n=1 Tax=Scortum barcoo TaxID=214431 RepID=A0ACB8VV01_9TELE|nr:hypothetical protein L3Q82_013939 [Scortum barcoo]